MTRHRRREAALAAVTELVHHMETKSPGDDPYPSSLLETFREVDPRVIGILCAELVRSHPSGIKALRILGLAIARLTAREEAA